MEITLLEAKEKKILRIKRLDGGTEFQNKLSSMNIRTGKDIKKKVSQPLNGPIIIEIDNTSVAIGRNMCSKIIVEEK